MVDLKNQTNNNSNNQGDKLHQIPETSFTNPIIKEVFGLKNIQLEMEAQEEVSNKKSFSNETNTSGNASLEGEDDDLPEEENIVGQFIVKTRSKLFEILKKPIFKKIFLICLIIAYPIYFGFSMKLSYPFNFPRQYNSTFIVDNYVFSNNQGLALFILTVVGVLFVAWDFLVPRLFTRFSLREKLNSVNKLKCPTLSPKIKKIIQWIIIGLFSAGAVAYLFSDLKDYYNLVSLAGLFTFILICIFLSEYPSKINWRILVVGILIQYALGIFILRSQFGYKMFEFLGQQVSTFLDYTDSGSQLVFGTSFRDHYFAFKVMPVLIFFSSIVNVLYYFGIIQYLLIKLAWIMNFFLGTSPTESINSVANLFLGPSEAPLLIKPLLPIMSESELFAIITAGFSTVSGSVLAAYIGFGVPPDHLITAGLMSAPASLAIAKTLVPERKKTKADWEAVRKVKAKKVNNVFDAISTGAIDMTGPIAAIVSNLIAFVSIFSFLDAVCRWIFGMLLLKDFGLASILQYLFWPFAFLMGVNSEDCESVAKLVGFKVFINEFIAFTKLGSVIKFRDQVISNGTFPLYRNGTLPLPVDLPFMIWNERSIVIATYAICGFANFGTIGIIIATMSMYAPSRSDFFLKYAGRAMFAGNFSSFMNACIAGLLYKNQK